MSETAQKLSSLLEVRLGNIITYVIAKSALSVAC